MKTTIQILTLVTLTSTLSFAEGNGKHRGKPEGPDGPGGHDRPNPQEIFKRLDTDNSGGISLEEFKAGPRAQKDPEKATEIFGKIDADGDGQLTVEEFAKMHRPGGGDGDRPNPADIIKHLDKDGSGAVSLEEFKAGPRAQKNPDKAADLFGKIDGDGDGQLTTEEFARFHAWHKGRGGDGERKGGGNRRGGGDRPERGNGGGSVE